MKAFLILLMSVGIMGCQPKKASDPAPAPTEIGDTTLTDTTHTARNSLDYIGTYKGKFPCADCKNSEVILELAEDFTYTFSRYGNGKSQNKTESKGTYKWDASGKGIILADFGQAYDHFSVQENALVALDEHLEKLPEYRLHKLSDASAETVDESPSDKTTPTLTGIRWKLSEVNGKPIRIVENQKEYFIELRTDGSFSAFAGCNQMRGRYELKGDKVRLFQILSTMMACPEMATEDAVKKALESADNFVANREILQLRKDGTNLLKFESQGKIVK